MSAKPPVPELRSESSPALMRKAFTATTRKMPPAIMPITARLREGRREMLREPICHRELAKVPLSRRIQPRSQSRPAIMSSMPEPKNMPATASGFFMKNPAPISTSASTARTSIIFELLRAACGVKSSLQEPASRSRVSTLNSFRLAQNKVSSTTTSVASAALNKVPKLALNTSSKPCVAPLHTAERPCSAVCV